MIFIYLRYNSDVIVLIAVFQSHFCDNFHDHILAFVACFYVNVLCQIVMVKGKMMVHIEMFIDIFFLCVCARM